ncbi:hypothetical protein E0H22_09160 [Rhodopseudomonas boonkerdii]|uniref:hypothetical protein n=1 Tax=Rhodopseudomonas boonkerdii TaxID=475937 RepID=UPI001E5791E9|nr:hypothetical protein [Rhodopseudomonas boonkerdii]UGV25839.1 hypothetical protein E0H22_09160 [Rhodopseudomonas boonkerdii]
MATITFRANGRPCHARQSQAERASLSLAQKSCDRDVTNRLQPKLQLAQPLDRQSNQLNASALLLAVCMVEGIILGIVVFAADYTLAMRVMARRADVLYGGHRLADAIAT